MISHTRHLLALVFSIYVVLSFATAPSALAVPAIAVTKDDGVPAATRKNPGDIVTYTNTITNTGTTATGVQFTDPDVANTVLSGTVKISPVAIDDAYAATGNVSISIPAGSGVLANDFMGQNPLATITASSSASTNGGAVSVSGDGSFTYSPPVGFTGADTFTYTIGNVTGSSIGTVTVNVSNMIWFINNTAAAGTGTLASPFNSLASFQAVNDGVGTHPKNGDVIFIHTGSGNYTGGVTLRTNQKLIGQGASLSGNMGFSLAANSATLPSTGSNPTLANAGGAAITLGEGSAVFGTTVSNGTQTGIAGTVNAATIDSLSSITTTTGTALSLGAGNGNITVAAPITSGSGGRSVNVNGRTGGTVILSGSVDDSGTGISLTSNTGATIAFTGQITANTGTNTAFNVTGGGTVTATNTNSTLTSTTGITLNMASVSVGAAGLTFQSVSSNGATNGIKLSSVNCGAGGLNVIGDNNGRANGSGGSIANTTGGSLGNAPVHALSCSGTINLKSINMSLNTNCFSGMLVDNNASGTATVNVTGSTFTGVTTSVVQNKSLLQFETGASANVTANVQNCFFNGSRTYGFFATGAGTSTLNVTVNQCGFGTDVNTGAAVNQPGSSITNAPAIGMGITNGASALVDYTITNNTFWGANGSLGAIYAVTISGAVTTNSARLNGSFNFNKIGQTGVTGSGGANSVAALGLLPGTQGAYRATVIGNDIRQVNSVGINFFNSAGAGTTITATLKCKGNTIAEPDTTGSPALQRAIIVSPGNSGGGVVNPWTAEIGNVTGSVPADANVISSGWQAGNMIRINNANNTSTLTLPGLSPTSGATTAQINAYTQAANTLPAPSSTSTNSVLGGGIIGGALLPLMLAPGGVEAAPVSTLALAPVRHSDTRASASPTARVDQPVSSIPSLSLTQSQLDEAVDAAVERWVSTGLTPEQEARLRSLHFEVAALQGLHLGEAIGKSVRVDDNAGGTGWFADVSPASDALFGHAKATTRRYTDEASAPAGRIDLLTTLMHEMGHTLGLADSYRLQDRNSIMYGHLTKGERRLPAPGQAKGATPFATDTTHFLSGSINIGTLPAGKSVTIIYSVQIDDPVLGGATQLSSQATVSGSNFSNVLSDDPNAGGAADPTVTLIERPSATVSSIAIGTSPTNTGSVSWTVTFNTPISGLVASNLALINSGLTSPSISTVTASGGQPATTWVVTASTGTGNGTLGLNLANDTGLTHQVTNAPFTGGVYTIDKIAPVFSSITRQTPTGQNTNADTLTFRATFSENVTGLDATDFTVSGTTATITGITGTGPYDITVSGGDLASLNGTVGLNLAGGQNIGDAAGNALPGTEPATDETYTVDNTAPTVAITSTTLDPAANAVIPVTVTFNESVTGFDLTDITVAGGTKTNFAGSGTTYTFDLTPSGPGVTVTADVAGSAAQDAAGNNNSAATQFTRSIVDAVSIAATTATAAEGGATTGLYTFTRGASSGALTVSFQLDASSTATAATDFTLSGTGVSFTSGTGAGSVVIPDGSLTATVTLTALAETPNAAEAAETARLNVVAGSGYVVGVSPNATVTITENSFLVTTTANSGTGSLRQAVLNANSIAGTDTITFSDGSDSTVNFTDATADTITLSGGQISLDTDITIAGPGADLLIVQNTAAASATSRVFIVPAGAAKTVWLSGLTMTGGNPTDAGGGLLINSSSNATVSVIACAISGNSSTLGGGLRQRSGTLSVINSTISGNTAVQGNSSGGIDSSGTALTVVNSTLSGNSTPTSSTANGGAIWTNATTTTIRGCTITNNTGVGGVGGVRRTSGTMSVANSIIAGNVDNTTLPDVGGSFTSGGGNLIGNAGTATGFTNGANNDQVGNGASPINPQLAALANNGGRTQTHALLASSTALNAGLNAQIPVDTFDVDGDTNTTEVIDVDQRGSGFIRAIGTVDIGAFELQKSVSILADAASAAEGTLPAGNTAFTFTVSRTGDTTGAVTMDYAVSGAAVNATDFGGTLPSGTVTIPDGSANTTLTINVSKDALAELDEAFTVTLSNANNGYVVAGAPATSTINNDDTLTVTINQASGQADPASTSPINFTVVFSEPVTGFNDGDVTLGGAAVPTTCTVTEIAPNNGTTYNVAVSGMTAQGTVTASVGSNVALSAGGAGHAAATSTDNSVVFDSIAPTAGIVVADTTLLFGETSLVTITFSEAVTGFDNADLTIPNGTLTPVSSGDGIIWTATFTPSADTEAATNVIALAMTGVADAAGNAGTGTTNSNNFVIDTLRPTVTLTSPVANPAPNVAFTLTATFSEPVTGFATGDIVFTNAVKGTFTSVSTTVYTVVLIPDGSGLPVTVNVDANAANDAGGNGSTAATPFTRATYTKATISAAFGSAQVAISGTATLTYTLTNPNASHALTGVEFTDLLPDGLALATTPVAANNLGGTLTAVASTRAITLSGGTLDPGETASVVLNITGTVTGVKTSNFLIVTSAEAPNITTQDVFKTGSNTVPTFAAPPLNISRLFHDRRIITGAVDAADPTQTGRINRFGVISEIGVNKAFPGMFTTSGARNFESHNIVNSTASPQDVNLWINTSGVSGFVVAYLDSFNPTSLGTNYLADSGSSWPNTAYMGFTIPAGRTAVIVVHSVNSGVFFDYALGINTPLPAGAVSTIPATLAAQPSIEVIEKSVSIADLAAISEGNSGTTNFVFTITRTGATTGSVAMTYTVSGAAVNAADFGGSLPTGTATIADGSATTTVTIPVSGDVLAELDEAFTVTLSAPNNGYLVTGAPATSTITNDDTLTVTLNQAVAQVDPTNATTINFTAVFSEAVTDFDDAADVTLTGTAGATTTLITGGPTTYNVAVSGMTGSGTVIASIPAASVISAGSAANAASTSTDNTVTYDNVAPALASAIAISDTALKIGDTATVTFTFTEAVTGFDSADLTVPNGSIPSVTSGDGGITWTGTLTPTASIEDASNLITLALTGVADIATNPGIGTADSPNYAIDTVAPTVALTSAVPNPTPNVPIAVTAQFSETVVGFVAGSVTVVNATVSSFVAVDGDTYTFNLTPTGSNLIVTADITTGATQDVAGNNNIAATQFARTINAAPEITVPLGAGGSGPPVLYGISNGYGVAADNQIYEINPATGTISNARQVTLAGFTVTNSQSLAAHPTTGVLYGVIQTTGGASARRLVTIDPATGVATQVGAFTGGLQFATLAFKPDGTLIGGTGQGGTTPETLYTISTVDASATLLLALGNGADGETIAFHPNGLLYHSSGNSTALFESVNLTTNVVTPIGSASLEMFAMGYHTPTMQFLGSDISSNLFSIDIATGARTPIGLINGPNDNRGLAVAPGPGASLFRLTGVTTGINSPIATVSDVDTAAGSLVVTATKVPPGINITNIVNNAGAVTADVSADAGTAAGFYTVVLNVFDGFSNTTANLTIEVNNAPTVVAPGLADVSMSIGDVLVIPLAANFADVDLDTLTFTVSGNSFPAKASASITGGTNVTLTGLTNGVTEITIQADDSNLGLVTDTFQVAVGTLNPTHQQVGTGATYTQQTGLYRLTVNVTNTTAFAINGFRLHVDFGAFTAAHPSLRLYNATNAPGANPAYVDHPYPVAVDQTIPVELLFYTNNRRFPNPFQPILSVQILNEQNNGAGPAGPGVPITDIRVLSDGTKLLEWDTIPGRWYRIRFSSDLTEWFISPVPIQAGSNRQQWIDSGAPFTPISSADPSVTSRFYRVEEITLD